jgi:membrane-associated phospholipid phosphatase
MTRFAVLFLTLAVTSPALAQTASAVDAPEAMPSFRSLFTDLGHDVRHLVDPGNLMVLGVAGGAALAVHGEDVDVTRRASGSEVIDETLDGGAFIGSGLFQFGAAFGTYVIGRTAHDRETAVLGADLFRAQLMCAGLTQGIKLAVDRPRPDGSRYSFPSGHTSSSFATAAVLQRHYGWKVGAPAYALASYVGASRLSENMHFLSDVLFGAGIGIVSGRAVTVGHGTKTFALVPLAAPGPGGGGGLGLTLVGAQ